jgi:hypothetical protein
MLASVAAALHILRLPNFANNSSFDQFFTYDHLTAMIPLIFSGNAFSLAAAVGKIRSEVVHARLNLVQAAYDELVTEATKTNKFALLNAPPPDELVTLQKLAAQLTLRPRLFSAAPAPAPAASASAPAATIPSLEADWRADETLAETEDVAATPETASDEESSSSSHSVLGEDVAYLAEVAGGAQPRAVHEPTPVSFKRRPYPHQYHDDEEDSDSSTGMALSHRDSHGFETALTRACADLGDFQERIAGLAPHQGEILQHQYSTFSTDVEKGLRAIATAAFVPNRDDLSASRLALLNTHSRVFALPSRRSFPSFTELISQLRGVSSKTELLDACIGGINLPALRARFTETVATLNDLSSQLVQLEAAASAAVEAVRGHERVAIYRHADLVGLTVTVAALRRAELTELGVTTVLVEEAGELTEAQLAAALPSTTRQLLLLGDHHQLRPTVEHALARRFQHDVSTFERLVRVCEAAPQPLSPYTALAVQRRMRPEISALVRELEPEILDGPNVTDPATHAPVALFAAPVQLLTHDHACLGGEGVARSFTNEYEARLCAALVPALLNRGLPPSSIVLLTPYRGQMFLMRRALQDVFAGMKKNPAFASLPAMRSLSLSSIRVDSIDSYQGEESDVVILSLTRSEKYGHVRVRNRALVLVSRARRALIIIGHRNLFGAACLERPENTASEAWNLIVSHCLDHGYVHDGGLPLSGRCVHSRTDASEQHLVCTAKTPEDILQSAAWGGCSRPCKTRLVCGHVCHLPCHGLSHSYDDGFRCNAACARPCPAGHLCRAPCHSCRRSDEDYICPPCGVSVSHTFPDCGHTAYVPCFKLTEGTAKCVARCGKLLPCGHRCAQQCGHTGGCAEVPCLVVVTATCTSCSRKFQHECSKPATCPFQCVATLPCGHRCGDQCAHCASAGEHKPCAQDCGYEFPVCHHRCRHQCGQEHEHSLCQETVTHACIHGSIDTQCFKLDPVCREPCRRSCSCGASRCNHVCHEGCAPSCQKRCKRVCPVHFKLCVGVCGEECLFPCCQPKWLADTEPAMLMPLSDLLPEPSDKDVASCLYKLHCGHVALVSTLDRHVAVYLERCGTEVGIAPIPCPYRQGHGGCQRPIQASWRYSAQIRQVAQLVGACKARMIEAARPKDRPAFYTPVSEQDRAAVVAAMQDSHSQSGHWFRCRNTLANGDQCGYLFFIGECGGAMEIATCPNCKGNIGGINHAPNATTEFAGDIDGANTPAWPTMDRTL